MYGRGRLGGMDDGAGAGPTRKGSTSTQLADLRERRNDAKGGYDDRHWTEKPLEEMKERDWRIFREDFSISARGMILLILDICELCLTYLKPGGAIPHPLRSWTESMIPQTILD